MRQNEKIADAKSHSGRGRLLRLFWPEHFFLRYNFRFLVHFYILYVAAAAIFRLVFLLYNRAFAAGIPLAEILDAFVVGVRFDTAAFAFVNLPFLLLLSIPVKSLHIARRFKLFLAAVLFVNFLILFVNGIDVIYYSFSEKRTTFELLVLKKDLVSFSLNIFLDYAWLFAILFLVTGGIVLFFVRWERSTLRGIDLSLERRSALDIVFVFIMAALAILGMRGGIQMRSLSPGMAFFSNNLFTGNLASNSAFNLIKSVAVETKKPVHFFDKTKAADEVRKMIRNDFDGDFVSEEYPLLREAKFNVPTKKYNVVLLVMESMNGEDVGALNGRPLDRSLTPQFDRLSGEGLLFTRYFSNARRSIEAFPAILNSLPDILNHPIIESEVEANNTWGIGNILSAEGYDTMFFHGGRNGTMGLQHYSVVSGFQHYYGKNEYEAERGTGDFDGHWGIYDDKFFDYFYDKLAGRKSPYLAVIFSLSNHYPFGLPAKGWDDIKKLPLPANEKTFRYADAVIGRFFEKVRKNSAFKNTIFIVTADHYTFHEVRQDRSLMSMYHIPLLIYAPGIVRPGRNDRIANHLNLLPTLIDLLKIHTYHSSLGTSLLETKPGDFAIMQNNGIYSFVTQDHVVITNFDQMNDIYSFHGMDMSILPGLPVGQQQMLLGDSRALYQTVFNALVTNTIIPADRREILK